MPLQLQKLRKKDFAELISGMGINDIYANKY